MAAEYVARIGARIRDRRKELGLTQRQLADAIPGNADSNQVSKWERGVNRPNDTTLEHIARALDIEPVDLMTPKPTHGTTPLMHTFAGTSQLDRIEAKQDAILAALATPLTPEQVLALARAGQLANDKPDSSAPVAPRKPGKGRAA